MIDPNRPKGYRQPPLHERENVISMQTPDGGPKVYAAPHCLVFIEAMWNGDYQQVPVDPETIPALIVALTKARVIGNADDVLDLIDAPEAIASSQEDR